MKKPIILLAVFSSLAVLGLYVWNAENVGETETVLDTTNQEAIPPNDSGRKSLDAGATDPTSGDNMDEFTLDKYCSGVIFSSLQQQADSMQAFMKQAQAATANEKIYWEKKFFCAFPESYAEMDSLFGFRKKGGPLYDGEIATEGTIFGSMHAIIHYFSTLNSIPAPLYYEKYINICVDGFWQADNMRAAFGFGQRLADYPAPACRALEMRTDAVIKSVFRFIFDSIHPNQPKVYLKKLINWLSGKNGEENDAISPSAQAKAPSPSTSSPPVQRPNPPLSNEDSSQTSSSIPEPPMSLKGPSKVQILKEWLQNQNDQHSFARRIRQGTTVYFSDELAACYDIGITGLSETENQIIIEFENSMTREDFIEIAIKVWVDKMKCEFWYVSRELDWIIVADEDGRITYTRDDLIQSKRIDFEFKLAQIM